MKNINITKQKIITIICYIIILSLYFYISWFLWTIEFMWTIAIYWSIIYLIIWIFKKLKNKEFKIFKQESFRIFLESFIYRIWILMISLIIVLWCFSYYQNEISPARMPIYTISNWEKTVVFEAMSHIWSENFYKKVRENIKKYKENWFVLFFEWVKWWTKENQDKFNKALWVDFNPEIYENFSKLYWLTYQDNSTLLNIVNNKDFNVDVTIDDIISKYEKSKLDKNITNREYKTPIDINTEIKTTLSILNDKQLNILKYINKAMINVIIKSNNIQQTISDNFANKELFDIILNKRNEVIAKEIKNSEHKKIIVTYWLLHFEWIFNILKQNDIKWHIKRIDYVDVTK